MGILEMAGTWIRDLVGDFGETHSITPLIDSLTVLDLLQRIDPNINMAQYTAIMKAMADSQHDLPNTIPETLIGAAVTALGGTVGEAAALFKDNRLYDADALENMVNALTKLFTGTNPHLTPDISTTGFANLEKREALHTAIKTIDDMLAGSGGMLQTGMTSLIGMSTDAIIAKSQQTDAEGQAYRYALNQLNPFVVTGINYTIHNANAELDLYDASTGTGTLTEQYLSDRAKLLGWQLKYASGQHDGNDLVTSVGDKPYTEDWDTTDVKTGNWIFTDTNTYVDGKPLEITIDGTSSNLIDPTHHVIFGSDSVSNPDILEGGDASDYLYGMGGVDELNGGKGDDHLEGGAGVDTLNGGADADTLYGMADADTLNGGDGEDQLYGGTDNDTLTGGLGADYLAGGEGTDTYLHLTGDGDDTIEDSDGLGSIEADGRTLDGGTQVAGTDNLWQSADRKTRYALYDEDDGSQTLNIYLGSERLYLKNYTDGLLGITLAGLPPPTDLDASPDTGSITTTAWYSQPHSVIHAGPAPQQITADGAYGEVFGRGQLIGNNFDNHLEVDPIGDSDNTLTGNGGRDVLVGNGLGNNTLDGGTGDDVIFGGHHNDLLIGGEQTLPIDDTDNDILSGGTGDDILLGGAGNDYLFGGGIVVARDADWQIALDTTDPLNPRPYFDHFNIYQAVDEHGQYTDLIDPTQHYHNTLPGGSDSNLYSLDGDGNDWLDGGAGDDKLWGGQGNDILNGGADNDQVIGDSGNDLIYGGAGNDNLHGDGSQSANADHYTYDQYHGNDILDGGAGNDYLTGDGGNDTLYGGTGDDELIGDAKGVDIQYQGNDFLDGGDGNDKLWGYGKDDTLIGGDGNDKLYGDSSDIADADNGNDMLDGGAGDDFLVGGGGDDILFGGAGNDLLGGDADGVDVAYQGNDILDGGAGDDQLQGGGGDDTLLGGTGTDQLYGQDGNDSLDGGEDNDTLFGGLGQDSLMGGAGNDILTGDEGSDNPDGGDADILDGGAGNDVLFGQGGDDTLTGGTGNDQMQGGVGNDNYILNLGDGQDTLIDSSGFNTIRFGEGISASDITASYDNASGNLTLTYGNNGTDRVTYLGGISGNVVSFYQFADGSRYSHGQLMDIALPTLDYTGTTSADTVIGGGQNDIISGKGGNDSLAGNGGNDQLDGGLGNDRLEGNAGDDTLTGGEGSDTYTFAKGDGHDTIIENHGDSGTDTLMFDEIYATDISYRRLSNGDLRLDIIPSDSAQEVTDSILIQGWFNGATPSIERFIFGDDSELTVSDLQALTASLPIEGSAGDDLFQSAAGNNTYYGGAGNDTYQLGLGQGLDTVIEAANETSTIQLDASITLDNINAYQRGNDLAIILDNAQDGLTFKDYFSTAQNISIFDAVGNSLDVDGLMARTQAQSSDNAVVVGKLMSGWILNAQQTAAQNYLNDGYHYSAPGVLVKTDRQISANYAATDETITSKQLLSDGTIVVGGAQQYHYLSATMTDYVLFDGVMNITSSTIVSNGATINANDGFSHHLTSSTVIASDVNWGALHPVYDNSYSYNQAVSATTIYYYDITNTNGNVQGNVTGFSLTSGSPFTGSFSSLPNTPRLNYQSQQDTYTITQVKAGTGNNVINDATVADGGAGNDTLNGNGSTLLFGNSGNDQLYYGALMIGGEGDDSLYGSGGANRYFYTRSGNGTDVISDTGTDADAYRDWYYPLHGIPNWQESQSYGGKYSLWSGEGGYWDSLDDVRAFFAEENFSFTVEDQIQNGNLYYIPVLTPITTDANDYAALAGFYAAHPELADTIEFASGVSLSDLSLSWGAANGHATLQIAWNGDSLVNIEIPHGWEEIGTGIERFKFADGTVVSMAEMMANAPLPPDLEIVQGGAGDELLVGHDGADVLDGGAGNDQLDGGQGNDTYRFGVGYGQDTISEDDATAGNIDTVQLAEGITPADVTVYGDQNNLYLSLGNGADRLTLANWFLGEAYQIEQVVFADGTVWDATALLAQMGDNRNETLIGTDGDDVIDAHGGDDLVMGLAGDDTLDGGTGDDVLNGGVGNDTYIFGPGYGRDVVNDYDSATGNIDVVQMLEGVIPGDVTVTRDQIGYDLTLSLNNGVDQLTLSNWFYGDEYKVEQVVFADGTVWDVQALLDRLVTKITGTAGDDYLFGTANNDLIKGLDGDDYLYSNEGDDTLYGNAGNDTLYGGYGKDILDGGTGNDYLSGGEGNDVYVFGPGYGQDSVYDYDSNVGNVDTVRMADGVTPSDVTVTRDPNSLYLSLNGGADRLMLDSWFAGDENRIEQVEFSDGTVWDAQAMIDHIVDAVATEYSDALMGTTADDVIDGLNGDDFIIGMAGNDILRGGDGNDDLEDLEGRNYLAGEAGDDYLYADTTPSFIMGNSGSDSIASFAQNNVVAFNRGDGIDSITVGQALTLSLGGGIALADLSITGGGYGGFILETGGDTVALQGLDPADPTTWPEITLQLIDGDIRRYDLKAELQAFNAAQALDPALTTWPLATTLVGNLLDVSTDQAIGGALAYQYAVGSSTAMPGDAAIRGVLADTAFGSLPQSINATVFDGTTGSDTLLGSNGADTLTGGAGNDVLAGGAGNDTYVFNLGDGVDHIQDTAVAGEGNTLVFGDGITAADINLGLGSLLLRVGSNGDAIHLDNFNPGDATGTHTIETFRFADGTELSYSQLLAKGFDLSGSDGNDTLSGTSVNDRINGLAGDDVIDGGAGDDTLMGGDGSDTYRFGLGYGADSIEDQNVSGTDTNIVQMGAGVSASDITATFDGTYLNLAINGTSDNVSILWDAQNGYGMQRVVFADGTVWNESMLDALVTPPNAAPELVTPIPGQSGVENHVFTFQIPADTFVDPDVGDVLSYSATLANGAALPSWLSLNATTGVFSGTLGQNDSGTLSFIVTATDQGGLTASGSFDLDVANLIQGTQYSDTLTGTAGNDYITAGAGNDTVNAGDGNDTIIGGAGSDVLAGGAGNDTFVVEGNDTGYDRFEGDAGYDVIQGGAGDDFIRVTNFSGAYTVEKIDGGAGVNVVAGTQYSDTIDLSGTELVNIAYITGTAGNDTIIGSAGDDTIIGDLGSDVLAGGAGNDTFLINGSDTGYDRFEGDAGYDVIQGGSGDDVIRVSNFAGVYTAEKIDGGAGTNTVAGTQYSDTIDLSGTELVNIAAIDGGLGNDTITGSAGNDVIIGGTGSDVLAGGSGNDTFLINGSDTGYDRFEGDAGYDVIQGGAGDDVIRVSNFTGTYTVEKIDGGTGTNTVTGTQYSDSIDLSGTEVVNIALIDGGLGNDTITGSAGNDVILGGIGSDVLAGGAGNDTFVIDGSDTGYDRFQGDAGYDVIQGGSADDVIRVSNFSSIYTVEKIDGGAGSNTIAGTQYSDTIDLSGTALVNIAAIDGGVGNDTITGSTGDDVIIGGTGADVLASGAGNDTFLISGSDTNYDRFEGDAGYDVIQGGMGDDVIRVSNFSGAYTVEKIDGGAGSNIIAGTQYSDTIDLSATQLVNIGLLDGGLGNDTLTGSAGNDLVRGGDGADKLTDSSGSNLLDGGTGNDVLIGGAGNELLIGGTGNDTITTGNGYDVIAFNTGDGQDTVNASTGADDTISLGGGIKYADLSFSKSGNNLILKTGGTDQITLSNWYASASNHSVLDLQVISEAMADFAPGGSDVLKDNKVETFNFAGLVDRFDQARTATPTLTSWALTNALLDFHLSGSDTDAIGGDLAYQYGKAGTLSGIGLNAAQSVVNAAPFGQSAQVLNASSTWQSETVKLG